MIHTPQLSGIVVQEDQLMTLVDALKTQLAASRATAANLLSALVAGLTTSATRPSANGASHPSPGQRPGKMAAKPTKG